MKTTGILLLILSQLMWAVATVIGKKLLTQTSPLLFTAIVLLLSGLMFLPIIFFFDFNKEIKPFLTGNIVLIIIYTLFWLVLGELLFNAGLSRLSPTVAALLMFTLPLFTALISIIFLKEPLTLRLIIGAILILSGVFVISK